MRSSDKQDPLIAPRNNGFDSKHDEITIWLYSKVKAGEIFRYNGPDQETFRQVLLEHPILGNNSRTIGFADLMVRLRSGRKPTEEEIIKWTKDRDGIPEFTDAREDEIYVEVKSKVNIGETIRQIKYYSVNGRFDCRIGWYVCAPPFKNSEILEEQGIGFIPYDPSV